MLNLAAPSIAPPRSRTLRRIGWLFFAALCITLAIAVVASLKRPAWYRPASIDYAHLEEDKRALVGLYDRISADLNAGRPCRFTIDEAQLNRWIAANAEFWPHLASRFALVDQPVIRFPRTAEAEVAATFSQGQWRSVGCATIRITVPGRLHGQVSGLQVGALPLPARWLWPIVKTKVQEHARHGVELEGEGITVFNEWVWENGKVPFRVSEIQITPGQATLVFTPLKHR